MQAIAPALLNWPHLQGTTSLLPSHVEPAGQTVQVVRVVGVPPLVYEPATQVLQDNVLPSLYRYPTPHSSCLKNPLHVKPAGQVVQLVRLLTSPPLVYDPAPHVLQAVAPAPLNFLSEPHGTCTLLPSHS